MILHIWLGDPWGLMATVAGLALWALVVLAIVALVRSGERVAATTPTAALRILEERYARGEISREEFMERRRVLGAQAQPGAL